MSHATFPRYHVPQAPTGLQPPVPGAFPGGFAPGAPAGPLPQQPWPPQRRRTGPVVAVTVSILVVALVAAGVLLLTLGGGPGTKSKGTGADGGLGAGGGGASSTTVDDTDEVPQDPGGAADGGDEDAGTSDTTSTDTPPDATPTDPPVSPVDVVDPAEFLDALPADFASCTAEAVADTTGTLVSASCGAATSQPGPEWASFWQYGSAADLTAVFRQDTAGVGALPAGHTCATAQGYGRWSDEAGSGEIACYLTDAGEAVLAWTDEEHLIEAFIVVPDGTQLDLRALYTWWQGNAFYGE